MAKKIALFIPCYNEELRLKLTVVKRFINSNKEHIDFIFIDDGSVDNTPILIADITEGSESAFLIRLDSNKGKGNALREGINQFLKFPYEYFGFVDADMEIPYDQINKLYQSLLRSDCLMAISSRNIRNRVSLLRVRSLGSLFMIMVANRIIDFRPRISDTQCGCKLFHRDIAEICFKEEFLSAWLFDIEMFLRLKNKFEKPRSIICEVPLEKVSYLGSSKFRFRQNFKIIKQVYQIRAYYK